jgi:chromosome segregation ATPase
MNNETNNTVHTNGGSKAPFVILGGALAVALAANGFLWVRSNNLNEEIAKSKDSTSVQIAQLTSDQQAARDAYEKRLESLTASLQTTSTAANAAAARVRAEAHKQAEQFQQKFDESQAQLTGQINQLKDTDTQVTSKIDEVAGNVTGVKTDVDGVKTEVGTVKEQVASAQTALEAHATELKRMTGDMGVMSDRIATNGKDLNALRALGERNYYEFTLSKADKAKKVGDIILTYKKADPKRNRYTVEIAADDKKIEKKDKTVNEPVQIFVSGNRQASEIVVNQVGKDQITGYVSIPKVMVSRR